MRGLKYLFTVPEGEKITEKHLTRVLVSSICSILLCMTCLVSTTWAWFTVSVENTGNTISVGEFAPDVTLVNSDTQQPVNADASGKYVLAEPGTYILSVHYGESSAVGYCHISVTDLNDERSFRTVQLDAGASTGVPIVVNANPITVDTNDEDEGEAEQTQPEPTVVTVVVTPRWGTPASEATLLQNVDSIQTVINVFEPVTEDPANDSEDESGDESGEQPGGESGEQPGGESGEQPGGESGEQPGGESGEQTEGESGEQTEGESGEQTEGESGEQSGEESSEEAAE